jgi:hypothetical protein
MSERVIVEVETRPEEWTRLGSVAPDEQPGSLADERPGERREYYIFGWRKGQGPCVWKTTGGLGWEEHDNREILSTGLDVTAHLNTGSETIQLTGRGGRAFYIRFRYQRS